MDDSKQDLGSFLKTRAEEVADQQELPRVCEERGKLYLDRATGTRARLMVANWDTRCEGCGAKVPKDTLVLGVPPDEDANKSGRWVFGCLECANHSAFEAVTTQSGLFKGVG